MGSKWFAAVLASAGCMVAVYAQQDDSSGKGAAMATVDAFQGNSPQFTDDGQLIRPKGWRKWVYVGTPLTPHDMNDGKASFPEFHNVYVDPDSFSAFQQTGEFPNGTQLVKELTLVGSKAAVSGNGYFMGEFAGLEVALKDTVRFKDEPGGWAYFSFGHVPESEYAETAKAFPSASCNACHESSAETDFVFTQYYPVLRAAMPMKQRQAAAAMRMQKKQMDDKAMSAAMDAMGADDASGELVKPNEYAMKVFAWLQNGAYENFTSEAAVHPSTTGAVHGDVRTFVNDTLNASLEAGNKTHPIGSVAVKELHKDGAIYGWAASIKARQDDGKGNGWYWYETLSTTDGSKPVAASVGNSLCVGCHSTGDDFVRAGIAGRK